MRLRPLSEAECYARCYGAQQSEQFSQVRLIHGRGIGVQRENIRALLRSLDVVADFHDADPSGGGWGSTIILLAPNSLNRE